MLKKEAQEKVKLNNNSIISNFAFQCYNCKVGFKLGDNKPDSCKFHSLGHSSTTNSWYCCNTNDAYCKVGYHTVVSSSPYDFEKIFATLSKYSDSLNQINLEELTNFIPNLNE